MTLFDKDELQLLYQYGLSLSSNKDLAYDLLQSTLERCLRLKEQPDKPMAYARTILRNLFIDHHRYLTKVNEEVYEDDVVSLHIGMQPLEDMLIDRDELDKIWAFLKPFETEVLYLWAVEGYSLEEVAKQLEIPKGTALARVHRLRTKLKTLLNHTQKGDTA